MVTVPLGAKICCGVQIDEARRISSTLQVPDLDDLFPISIGPMGVEFPDFIWLKGLSGVGLGGLDPAVQVIFMACFHANFIKVIQVQPIGRQVMRPRLRPLFACFLRGEDGRIAPNEDAFRDARIAHLHVPGDCTVVVLNNGSHVAYAAFFGRFRPLLEVVNQYHGTFFLDRVLFVEGVIVRR